MEVPVLIRSVAAQGLKQAKTVEKEWNLFQDVISHTETKIYKEKEGSTMAVLGEGWLT
jgi:hypothetical protein